MKKLTTLILTTLLPLMLFSCASSDKEAEAIDTVEMRQSAAARLEEEKRSREAALELERSALANSAPKIGSYQAKDGDTLMWVSFLVYGDYSKWHDLVEANPQLVGTRLSAGDVINYVEPDEKFIWQRTGNPYYIEQGDTLGSISQKLYYTPSRWHDLYQNNAQMIKNPDLIFAGFTLYAPTQKGLAMIESMRNQFLSNR